MKRFNKHFSCLMLACMLINILPWAGAYATDRTLTIAVCGQSNAVGADVAHGYTTASPVAYNWNDADSTWISLIEPFTCFGTPGASFRPYLANLITANTSYKRVKFIPVALASMGVTKPDVGNWSDSLSTTYAQAVAQINAAGGCDGLLYYGGETDVVGNVSSDNFKAGIHDMISHFREDLGDADLPIFFVKPNYYKDDYAAYNDTIRAALVAQVALETSAFVVADAADCEAGADSLHLTRAGQDTLGQKIYASVMLDSIDTNTIDKKTIKNISILAIGGGGGGGAGFNGGPGSGGGAGGYVYFEAYPVTTGEYVIDVGAGGNGSTDYTIAGSSGDSTVFDGAVARGGGGGAKPGAGQNGLNGGCGGGSYGGTGGVGSQGGNGGTGSGAPSYNAGGGGGTGGNGVNADVNGGDGGVGTSNSITGAAVYYGGGGGGGCYSGVGGAGGNGGGGAGGADNTTAGNNATANTGGGGGGGGATTTRNGGNGGSGVVIVRILTTDFDSISGGVKSTDGNYTVVTFTSDDTLRLINTAIKWTNASGDGLWSTATNWRDNVRPTAADDVLLDATSVDNLTIDSNAVWTNFSKTAAYTGNIYFGATIDTTRGNVSLLGGINDTIFWQTGRHVFLGNVTASGIAFSSGTNTQIANGTTRQVCSLATPTAQHFYDITAPDNAGSLYFGTDVYVDGDLDIDKTVRGAAGVDIKVSGDMLVDAAGATQDTAQLQDSIVMNGASSTLHFGSTIVPQLTTAIVRMNTATAGVIDDDKGSTFESLTIGANDTVTNSGEAATTYNSTGIPLVMRDSSSLTVSQTFTFARSTDGQIHNIGNNCRLNGIFTINWVASAANADITIPAYQYTGTGITNICLFASVPNGCTGALAGNIDLGTAVLQITDYNSAVALSRPFSFSCGTYGITCGTFRTGSRLTSGSSMTMKYGSGTHNFNAFDGASYNIATSTHIDSFQTSIINCATDFTAGSNHIYVSNSGQSLTMTGTGILTSAGKYAPDSLLIASSGTVTMADRWKCGALNVASGTLAITDHSGADTVARGLTVANGATINWDADTVYIGGDVSLGATSTVSATTGKWIAGKDGVVLALNGKSIPLVQLIGSANLTSSAATGGTLAGLTMPAAGGDTVRFQHSKRWTFGVKPTLRGTARNYWLSSLASSRDTIDLPANDTLHNFYIRDQVFLDTVTCNRADTCLSGGGNY